MILENLNLNWSLRLNTSFSIPSSTLLTSIASSLNLSMLITLARPSHIGWVIGFLMTWDAFETPWNAQINVCEVLHKNWLTYLNPLHEVTIHTFRARINNSHFSKPHAPLKVKRMSINSTCSPGSVIPSKVSRFHGVLKFPPYEVLLDSPTKKKRWNEMSSSFSKSWFASLLTSRSFW